MIEVNIKDLSGFILLPLETFFQRKMFNWICQFDDLFRYLSFRMLPNLESKTKFYVDWQAVFDYFDGSIPHRLFILGKYWT